MPDSGSGVLHVDGIFDEPSLELPSFDLPFSLFLLLKSDCVLATLVGCASQSLASWEKSWIACAAAWFGVRFFT